MSKITDHELSTLRALPIEGVAQRLGLTVNRHVSLCPFHDDRHPSLHYNVSKNTYRCYVCDAHGGVIDLVMNHLHKTFVETCEWLANENNIIIEAYQPAEKPVRKRQFDATKYLRFFEQPFLNEQARAFLFGERHLDPRVIHWCKLNSFTDRKGISWLQIPYYDLNGKLIGVQSRNLNYSRPKQGELERVSRFKFPYGSTCHIYNLPVLKMLKPNEPLYIAEGASDCWSLLSAGHKAIAIPSATLLTKKDKELLTALLTPLSTELHMYPDADIPGEKLYIQLVQLSVELGLTFVRHSLPTGCKDYSDYYLKKQNL